MQNKSEVFLFIYFPSLAQQIGFKNIEGSLTNKP